MEFYELRLHAGFPSRNEAATFCGVTPRTIRNWDKNGAPKIAISLLQLSAGNLDWVGPTWTGWRFNRQMLLTPENINVTPGDIRALPYLKQTLHFLQN